MTDELSTIRPSIMRRADLEAELTQLRAQNKQLREWNKGLWEMLDSHGIYIPFDAREEIT